MTHLPPKELEHTLRREDAADFERIREQIEAPDFDGRLDPPPGEPADAAVGLLPLAAAFSISPISGVNAGAVAVGASGRLYLGANIEFAGTALNATLHAEQSAVLNAWIHGETAIDRLAVSGVPCGHCRQFLFELSCADDLIVAYRDTEIRLRDLLPDPFGTRRKPGQGLLDSPPVELQSVKDIEDSLAQRALNAAKRSYTPHTRGAEGFVIEGDNGQIFIGRAAECVALNPSVPAVVCALNQRNLSAARSYTIGACAHARLVTALNSTGDLTTGLIARITNAPVRQVLTEHL